MEWYQQHLRTVNNLTRQSRTGLSSKSRGNKSSNRARKGRRTRRARNRRLAKERQRSSAKDELDSQTHTGPSGCTIPSDEEVQMEFTEEMLEFFATSHKHRMERDNNKKKGSDEEEEADHVNIEQVMTGQVAPSFSAPAEQPGLRRTTEMKLLYGEDAPMIHGMETALQLTFDRITDKHQPKLWPNMPLNITFS